MLGVIVPHEQSNWFFKVRGPEQAIESIVDPVRRLVTELKFENGQPVLELPEQWERISPGSGPFAPYAKVLIEANDNQMELTVTKLSQQADWDADVQANVNRWRGQMGLEPLQTKWAGAELLTEDGEASPAPMWVDLVAEEGAVSGGMVPPMMGAMPPTGSAPPPMVPVDSPDADTSAGQTPSKTNSGLEYDVPEGWREGAASGMRLASFDAGGEEAAVVVTMIRAGGDLKSNVGMWAGQVAGGAADESMVDAAMESMEELTVAGQPAKRLFLAGKGDEAQAIDIVIVEPATDGGLPLFIKMKGPLEAVRKQQAALTELVDSLRL